LFPVRCGIFLAIYADFSAARDSGGQVKDGPFTFCLVLYSDARLQPTSDHPGLMSEVPGIGLAALWFYDGPSGEGPVVQSLGLMPGPLQPIAQFHALQKGASGNRFGGVLLPYHSKPGDQVEWGVRVTTPKGAFGATIRATLSEHSIHRVSVVNGS